MISFPGLRATLHEALIPMVGLLWTGCVFVAVEAALLRLAQ